MELKDGQMISFVGENGDMWVVLSGKAYRKIKLGQNPLDKNNYKVSREIDEPVVTHFAQSHHRGSIAFHAVRWDRVCP